MTASVLRTQLSGVSRRPGRLLTTGLSVLVAAFVVFGTVLAYVIVTRTTLDTFSETPEAVSLVVYAAGGESLTPGQVAEVRGTAGVRQAVGRVTATFTVGDASSGNELELIADPGSGPLSRITLLSGGYPRGDREIAMDRRAAARLGTTVGGTLRLHTGDRSGKPVTVTVTGVVDGPRDTAERAYAHDEAVARISGNPGFPRVDVLAADGADVPSMMNGWSERLLDDPRAYVSVTTGEAMRVREAHDAVRQLDQIFALVAMFVAIAVVATALVATSTFRIVFAQRLRQLALLRTIGAQRNQLILALAVEGAVTGLVTGAVGVVLAQLAGLAAPAVAAASGRTLTGPGVPLAAAVAVVAGAGLLTAGAVLAPAFAAAGVAPLQALRAASTLAAERGVAAPRLVAGLLLVAATAGLGWRTAGRMGSSDALLHLVGVGALGFGALIVLGPVLIRPILAVAGWPLRRLGATGNLAVSGIGGTPRRAAAVSVVVALGVTMLAGTVVGISSLRLWTDREMAARTPADLAMFAESPDGLDKAMAGVRADPRFRDVTPFRMADFTAPSGNFSHGAIAIDMAAMPALRRLEAASGDIAALGPGTVILSAVAASDFGARVGDVVTLRSDGAARVEVVAILTGEAPLRMGAVLTSADLDALGDSSAGFLADVATGTRNEALAEFRRLSGPAGAEVAVLADERDKADGEVSSLFAAALGLLGLTVLIAVVGVGTTTGLSVLERTQEFGLARALGLTRARLRMMVGLEAGLYGLIGAVLGVVLGVPMAWLTLESLRLDLPLTFPAGWLVTIVAAIAGITVLAGLLPARRAARVSPVAALAID
ncbi:ABC transporter permease [Actinoplanes lobatus]|uniref:ABC transporter permease n=1 Tax=Actinoplanes lobatus TaxID=113568 RepID=A0A7W7MJY2_9ACTN|nr:ABC transporter permease [Actinoplanes lobatus]MBB4753152.1 putative ABC transport system permease protein [Actinoplanes lobatus]GGN58901.1 ABC transporter permease [Actinoplanes lobatus]GIE42987.1 ABC transporter permease [Actinoplanes lobatus]